MSILHRFLILSAVLALTVFSEDSFYKIRVYKQLLQDLFQKNLNLIFQKSQQFTVRDIYLDELGTSLQNVHLRVMPATENYDELELELFFDDGRITLEMHDLYIVGHGMITDPETKHLEVMTFKGPISTGNIIIDPQEIMKDHEIYPKFSIEEVNLVLDQPNIVVTSHGQTPLFKSKKFEEAINNWLHKETNTLVKQIKQQLIEVEENIWKHIPFEYQGFGYKFIYSLSDKMELTNEFLEIGVISELYDVDHGEFKDKLRKIQPTFSEDDAFKQDVQMIFDENFINHALLALFYTNKVYSFREILMNLIPEKYQNYLMLAQIFFQTSTFSYLFPDLLNEFSHGKLMDMRCGFSKKFLSNKLDEQINSSQIKFKDGNIMDFDISFGCGVFAYMGNYETKGQLIEEKWKNWRSFFFQGYGFTKLKFIEQRSLQRIKAVIEQGELNIRELKVYNGDNVVIDEVATYSEMITNQFNRLVGDSNHEAYSLPFLSYPTKLDCLGMRATNPKVEIKEGFIRLSYDFIVKEADSKCLFPN